MNPWAGRGVGTALASCRFRVNMLTRSRPVPPSPADLRRPSGAA